MNVSMHPFALRYRRAAKGFLRYLRTAGTSARTVSGACMLNIVTTRDERRIV